MPALDLRFSDTEPAWPDLDLKTVIHVVDNLGIAGLSGGMASGKPSVALRINLPDGRVVIAETSLALFVAAARGFVARYGDPGAA